MNKQRVLDTFLDLVKIDSPSKHEAGVARYCEAALRELGCEIKIDDSASRTGSDTGNFIATLPGTMDGTLMFSAHMDCVEPATGVEPIVENGIISTAGDTVLGGDDKVGIASSIEAVRSLVESGKPYPTIKLVFTVQEEVGLVGAKHLDAADLDCDFCLVVDADGEIGSAIIGAPSHCTFDAVFTGRAAHAGMAPERGISAISMASRAIDMMKTGRLDEHTTANIGTISGGSADNVVAETCKVTGECRSLDKARVEQVRAEMTKVLKDAAEAFGGTVAVEWELEYDGFLYDENSPEVTFIKTVAARMGLTPGTMVAGGGSDANIMAGKGVRVMPLAAGMQEIHSTGEKLEVEDLEKLAAFLTELALSFEELQKKTA